MLELAFTAQDLAHVRFAFSPLWEVVASVRVLKTPADNPLYLPWTTQVRPRLDASALDWQVLSALVPVPTRVIPDFVSPPPSTPVPDLEMELNTLRATPADRVREMLDAMPGPRPAILGPLHDDPVAGLQRLAETITRYWELALAPYWPRMLTLLERDVLYRARRLAEGGTQQLFGDLGPQVTWDSDTLYVVNQHFSRAVSLEGRGLLLVPSVFVWPRVFAKLDRPWQPTLRYPPRGIATLWEKRDLLDRPHALARVLGRSRALLLVELDTPASTTDLARRTGLSVGGVSQHLTAMRAAGLVSAYRTGRWVLYARTAGAEALLAVEP
ncbi:MAG: transcriptional regulator [Pseudonocardiales bacterium]|nr:MAG: transcriptional regulator [Pseudonocardiales bacterium]